MDRQLRERATAAIQTAYQADEPKALVAALTEVTQVLETTMRVDVELDERPLATGDTVQLKSGGPLMTIVKLGELDSMHLARCAWYEASKPDEIRKDDVPIVALRRVEPPAAPVAATLDEWDTKYMEDKLAALCGAARRVLTKFNREDPGDVKPSTYAAFLNVLAECGPASAEPDAWQEGPEAVVATPDGYQAAGAWTPVLFVGAVPHAWRRPLRKVSP